MGAGGGEGDHELLTTREVAEYLRLKPRKIYDLTAADDIPHVRVSGKLLFPRQLIDAWLLANTRYAGGAERLAEPQGVIAGSHDPLLKWALQASGCDLPGLFDSSLDGLRRMRARKAIAAGVHLREDDGYNVAHVARLLAGQPVVAVEWAVRSQGLMVAPGNPLAIRTVADLAGRRVLPRQRAAGSFVLLEHVLNSAGLDLSAITLVEPAARSHGEVAEAIAGGRADAGIGLEASARAHGLDFVALAEERFDLVVWRKAWFDEPMQKLMTFAASARFRARAAELGGYDLSGAGKVWFNG